MTWGEFKAAVEAAGVKDDMYVFSIDIEWAFDPPIEVQIGKDGSVSIRGETR